MAKREAQIFRPEAIRRYSAGRDETVLPLFGTLRTGLAAWIIFGLFCAALVVAASAEVPVYVHGTTVPGDAPGARGEASAILIPAESLSKLKVGQRAFVELREGGSVAVSGAVTEVVAGFSGRAGADAPPDATPAAVPSARAAAVVFARFEWGSTPARLRDPGAPRAVRIEVGARRLGSFLTRGDR